MILVPVNNQPNQSFRITIPQDTTNITLELFIYWNRIAEYWQMTITNALTGIELINGLPMLTGRDPVQNLLGQWDYLNIGQAYVIPVVEDAADYPGVEDWGSDFILVWGP